MRHRKYGRLAVELVRLAELAGCEVVVTKRGHYRVTCPLGIVHVAESGDHRAVKNSRAELRRKGVEL